TAKIVAAGQPGQAPPGESAEAAESVYKSLLLEDFEQSYMQALFGFIKTPRLTKRFINIYRLLRVTAVEKGFEAFLGKGSGQQYRAALILLAINIGFPKVGGTILRRLIQSKGTLNFPEVLKTLSPPATGTGNGKKKTREAEPSLHRWTEEEKKQILNIRSLLETLDTKPSDQLKNQFEEVVPKDLKPYREWAPEVGRYSF
ncbi:MAG: hypothetical protein GY940_44055, partial [bacterium]|nr:hypothetical protein [bacterium]